MGVGVRLRVGGGVGEVECGVRRVRMGRGVRLRVG